MSPRNMLASETSANGCLKARAIESSTRPSRKPILKSLDKSFTRYLASSGVAFDKTFVSKSVLAFFPRVLLKRIRRSSVSPRLRLGVFADFASVNISTRHRPRRPTRITSAEIRMQPRRADQRLADDAAADVRGARIVLGEYLPGKVPCCATQILIGESLKILAQQRRLFEFLRGRGDLVGDAPELLE